MTERFAKTNGTISVSNGSSTVTGTGTTFAGIDLAGAVLYARPGDAAMFPVGVVAEVDPRGIYENLELPLVDPYQGETLSGSNYVLVFGPAIANGATQAAIFARYAAQLEQNAGLVYNNADEFDYALIQNNSLIIDAATRTVYQWRNGVLSVVKVIGDQWNPKGPWLGSESPTTFYDENDLVEHSGALFVSNIDSNSAEPQFTGSPSEPISDANWTWVPVATVADVLAALGVNSITISEEDPTGGQDNDLWFKVVS